MIQGQVAKGNPVGSLRFDLNSRPVVPFFIPSHRIRKLLPVGFELVRRLVGVIVRCQRSVPLLRELSPVPSFFEIRLLFRIHFVEGGSSSDTSLAARSLVPMWAHSRRLND